MITKFLFFVCAVMLVRSDDRYGISSAALHTVAPADQPAFINLGEYSGQTHKGIGYKKTYYMPKHFESTWIEAKMICKAFDLELATFETLYEFESFIDKANKIDYFTSEENYRFVLVDGMTLTPKSTTDWYWTNSGIKIPYDIPWINGEPNNKDNLESCLSMGRRYPREKFGFNDDKCATAPNAFLCQKTSMTN